MKHQLKAKMHGKTVEELDKEKNLYYENSVTNLNLYNWKKNI